MGGIYSSNDYTDSFEADQVRIPLTGPSARGGNVSALVPKYDNRSFAGSAVGGARTLRLFAKGTVGEEPVYSESFCAEEGVNIVRSRVKLLETLEDRLRGGGMMSSSSLSSLLDVRARCLRVAVIEDEDWL